MPWEAQGDCLSKSVVRSMMNLELNDEFAHTRETATIVVAKALCNSTHGTGALS